MKRKFKIKETGEIVEVIHTQFGRCRVRFINRPKQFKNGQWIHRIKMMRSKELEVLND